MGNEPTGAPLPSIKYINCVIIEITCSVYFYQCCLGSITKRELFSRRPLTTSSAYRANRNRWKNIDSNRRCCREQIGHYCWKSRWHFCSLLLGAFLRCHGLTFVFVEPSFSQLSLFLFLYLFLHLFLRIIFLQVLSLRRAMDSMDGITKGRMDLADGLADIRHWLLRYFYCSDSGCSTMEVVSDEGIISTVIFMVQDRCFGICVESI